MDSIIKPIIIGPSFLPLIAKGSKEADEASIFEMKNEETLNDLIFSESQENFQKHKIYKDFSIDSYFEGARDRYEDWERLDIVKNDTTGFASTVFKNKDTNEIVIAYRGTDDNYLDLKSGESLFKNQLPEQYQDAKKLYNDLKDKYTDSTITLTGHSLGGSLAQLVASGDEKTKAITFNAVGTKDTIEKNGLKDNKNIINYSASSDIASNILPQPGEVRTVNTGELPKKLSISDFKFGAASNNENDGHDLKNFHNLDEAQYLDKKTMQEKRQEFDKTTSVYRFALKNIPNMTDKITWFNSVFKHNAS